MGANGRTAKGLALFGLLGLSQGSGDVSNRFKIQMNKWYNGRVHAYGDYHKINIRKYLTEGLAFNGSLCGLDLDFGAKTNSKYAK